MVEEKLAVLAAEDHQKTTSDCDQDEVNQNTEDFKTCEECGQCD